MLLTTNRQGIPVFMFEGMAMSYADGIKRIKQINGLTSKELGQLLGVSRRTVEGWIDGKNPGIKRLLYLKSITTRSGVIKGRD